MNHHGFAGHSFSGPVFRGLQHAAGIGAVAVGLAFMHFFPIRGWLAATAGMAVSAAIVAVVLAATWFPTRQVLRVTPRDALGRE